MLEKVKKFIKYLLDIDYCRSEYVYRRSITGNPLIKVRDMTIMNTEDGLTGAVISTSITLGGKNVDIIKRVITGECDEYLTQECKDALIANIERRVQSGGKYQTMERNSKGTLDIVQNYWDTSDYEEICELLKRYTK